MAALLLLKMEGVAVLVVAVLVVEVTVVVALLGLAVRVVSVGVMLTALVALQVAVEVFAAAGEAWGGIVIVVLVVAALQVQ